MHDSRRRSRGWIPLLLLCGLVPLLAAAPGRADPVLVTTTTDEADGSCADGDCSLRDALATAVAGDEVQVPAGNFLLSLGELAIDKALTVRGAGARATVVDANFTSRVFFVSVPDAEISDLTATRGSAPGGNGGGILQTGGSFGSGGLTLTRCTVSNSSAAFGGGIYSSAPLTVDRCTITGNLATEGGGVLGLFRSTFSNSTISGNTAEGRGGGGSFPEGIEIVFFHSTITDNSAPVGGGLSGLAFVVSTLENSIVARNTGGDCAYDDENAPFISLHSIDGDGTCAVDLPNMDPLLDPLSDNGGPTDTHALLAGSPAIDSASPIRCSSFAIDQRGTVRPQGAGCDIGAFEAEVEMENMPPVLASYQPSVTVNEGQTAANTGTVGDGDTVTLSASVGRVVDNGDGTWSWSFATTDGPTQSQTVTITGDDGNGGTGTTSFALVVDNVAPTILSVSNSGPILVGGTATITVSATDPAGAGDPLSYSFDCDDNGSFEIGPQAGNSAACTFATAGSHTVNVRVTDGDGGTATGATVVTVLLPPPSCANATASPNSIWPPNHKFVAVHISGIVNPAPGAVTISVTGIFQDEPVHSSGSGNTSPDATGVGTANPAVRAERDGGNDGRVYHIAFTATGASGSCTGTVKVGVPKSQGSNGGPVDQGPLYNSTLP